MVSIENSNKSWFFSVLFVIIISCVGGENCDSDICEMIVPMVNQNRINHICIARSIHNSYTFGSAVTTRLLMLGGVKMFEISYVSKNDKLF